jgi:hypothetical protein
VELENIKNAAIELALNEADSSSSINSSEGEAKWCSNASVFYELKNF